MTLQFHPELGLYRVVESGLASVSPHGPTATNPADWIAWHFTKLAFLPQILQDGALLCDRRANPAEVIANEGIKAARLQAAVALPDHPQGCVGDHVPFYFSPRSPTSYWVLRHTCKATELVFFGVHVATITHNMPWCASDGNAAQSMLTRFTKDLGAIGTHVDLNVLTLQSWKDPTGEDQDRIRRRHAEFLVYDQVPLNFISHVACYDDTALAVAQAALRDVGGTRQYGVDKNMFMA